MINDMMTIEQKALHYVECYDLHFPDSGAGEVAKELRKSIEAAQQAHESDPPTASSERAEN